jgi:octaprenyl-diphosphate synthase
MWQEQQAELLKNEIEALLTPLSEIDGLHDLIREPLTTARRGLAVDITHDRPWPLLPLIVCEAIFGHFEHAVPAAAALQFLMAAGDVFDDIEDADSSESLPARYGTAIATNVATTLLILAERTIIRLKIKSVEDSMIVRVCDTINSYYTTACAGQHLDLSCKLEGVTSEEAYLRIIGMKSASQVECACKVGALLANTSQELISSFTKFGYNLGMAAQITNDIQGVVRGGDITKRKITLPVIYALNHEDNKVQNQIKNIWHSSLESPPDPIQTKDLMFNSGAIQYSTVKMEFYKQQALDILAEVEKPGVHIERLKLFM